MTENLTSISTNLRPCESSSISSDLSREQRCLADENRWLSQDVILAAELGKALLDQNKLLEDALEKCRSDNQEKNMEIELLGRQLSELREIIRKKAILVDEADCHILELDCLNRRLMQELNTDRSRLRRLKMHVLCLEQQIDYLLDEIKNCTRGHSLQRRLVPAIPVEISAVGNWVSRSASCSPSRRRASPSSNLVSHRSYRRRHLLTTDVFIDDELADQPQLSACVSSNRLHSVPIKKVSLSPIRSRTSVLDYPPISLRRPRSLSWPTVRLGLASTIGLGNVIESGPGIHMDRNSLSGGQQGELCKSVKPPAHNDAKASVKESLINLCDRCNEKCSSLGGTHFPVASKYPVTNNDDLKTLQDMLDDVMFIKRLETIYQMKLRSHVPSDYEPRYRKLFQDTFRMLRALKPSINPMSSNSTELELCDTNNLASS